MAIHPEATSLPSHRSDFVQIQGGAQNEAPLDSMKQQHALVQRHAKPPVPETCRAPATDAQLCDFIMRLRQCSEETVRG